VISHSQHKLLIGFQF